MVEEMLRCSKCGQLYVARPNSPESTSCVAGALSPMCRRPTPRSPMPLHARSAVPPTVNSPPSGSMSPWWSEVAGPATTPPTVISVPICNSRRPRRRHRPSPPIWTLIRRYGSTPGLYRRNLGRKALAETRSSSCGHALRVRSKLGLFSRFVYPFTRPVENYCRK